MTKLKNLKLTKPIIFFDLEATGTNPQVDRIVEICVAKLSPGGECEVKSRRVNPEQAIPAESTEIHGITDEDVKNEPTFAQISASLFLYFEDCDLAGYNINRFDIPLLANEFKKSGLNFTSNNRKIIDAQTIFHKMEPRTLSAAYKFFTGEELVEAHAAEADVLATIAVLDGELEKYSELPRDITELHEFCNPVDPRWIDGTGKFKWDDKGNAIIAFGKNKGLSLRDISTNNPGFLSWIMRMDFPEDAKKIAKDALQGSFRKRARKNMNKFNNKISALINLLEDENSDVSSSVIKELLSLDENKLNTIINNLQESPNIQIRKRIHQVQSIIRIRKMRITLSSRLNCKNANIIKGLIELHLLWFDRDSEEYLKKQFKKILAKAKEASANTTDKLAAFMKSNKFVVARNGELEPDTYCLGSVLETKIGTDIILCALAYCIAKNLGWKGSIINRQSKFMLLDSDGYFIDPINWQKEKLNQVTLSKSNVEKWDSGMILRFTIYQLLLCAATTGSYRYVYTMGICLENMLTKNHDRELTVVPNDKTIF